MKIRAEPILRPSAAVYVIYIQQLNRLQKLARYGRYQLLIVVALKHPSRPQNRAYFTRIYQFAIYNLERNYRIQLTAMVKGLRSSNRLKSVTKSRSTQVTQ